MAYKGKFNPKNPNKYKGDPTNIIYRSRWEL
ncbi:MAG: head completion protein, partial [Alphaproteobacteria bacterium]|nr:head completion protein [Alphaproteobacteria bacterium]